MNNKTFGFCSGFKGFLMNAMSLKSIYNLYVETDILPYIQTYNLSQDSLESLFSRVRSLNGNSDNPPVMQFTSAFRKILVKNEITAATSANCADNLKLYTVSSRSQKQKRQNNLVKFNVQLDPSEDDLEYLSTLILCENDFLTDCYEEATIASIAGSIEQKILRDGRFECGCNLVLMRNLKYNDFVETEDITAPCISTFYKRIV